MSKLSCILALTTALLRVGTVLAEDEISATPKLTVARAFSKRNTAVQMHRPFSQRLHTEDSGNALTGYDPTWTIVETMLPPLKNNDGQVLKISDLCPLGELEKLVVMAGAGGVFEISLADWSVKTLHEDEPGVMGTNGLCVADSPHVGYIRYDLTSGTSTFSGYHLMDGKFINDPFKVSGEVKSIFFGEMGLLLGMVDGKFMILGADDKFQDCTDYMNQHLDGTAVESFPMTLYPVFIGEHADGNGGTEDFVGALDPNDEFYHVLSRRVTDAFIDISFEGAFIFKGSYDVMQVINSEDVLIPLAGDQFVSGSRDGPAASARFGELTAVSYSSTLKSFFVADSNGLRRMLTGSPISSADGSFLDSLSSIKGSGVSLDGSKRYHYDLHFGPGTSINQLSRNGQASASLGTVQASNYLGDGKFSFDGGAKCQNGVMRRGTLQLLCAEAETVFVTETELCVYEILYASTDFCK